MEIHGSLCVRTAIVSSVIIIKRYDDDDDHDLWPMVVV